MRLCGCWLYSRLLTLSDFVSGFLTHVLMAIKDFSLFGTYFFPKQFVLFNIEQPEMPSETFAGSTHIYIYIITLTSVIQSTCYL